MERIPILKMGDCLLVTIQVDMHDQLALALQDDLTQRIVRDRRARRADRHLGARDRRLVHRPHARQHRRHGARAGRARPWWSACGRRSPSRWSSWACRSTGVRTALDVERGMALLHARRSGRRPHDDASPIVGQRMSHCRRLPLRPTKTSCACARPCANGRSQLGFSLVDQTKMVTAASELARNTLELRRRRRGAHRSLIDGARRGCGSTSATRAPASPTSSWRCKDGYTTGGGLGLGLGGAKRLVRRVLDRHRRPDRAPASRSRDGNASDASQDSCVHRSTKPARSPTRAARRSALVAPGGFDESDRGHGRRSW